MAKVNLVFTAIAATTLSLGLTGCGKDKYEGNYTGYEIRSYATGTGQTPTPTPAQTNMGYNSARAISLTASNNGDVVTGTYSVTAANTTGYNGGYTGGYNGGTYGQAETYAFTASSTNSGQLSNVMLISTGGYSQYSNCLMQGTLASQNRGQTLSGTLTAAASGGASNCGSIQISLTRGN